MAGENHHRVPGERLSSRLSSRTHRRPRMGMSPAFYLRFGLEDPWLPTGPVGADHDEDGLHFSYVSRRAYDQHLLRLAWARRRRDARLERLSQRYGNIRLKAANRRWPGESTRPRFSFGLVSISDSDMVMPPRPAVDMTEDELEEYVAGQLAEGGRRGEPGAIGRSGVAWFSRETAPAKVFTTQRRPVVIQVASPEVREVVVEREVATRAVRRARQPVERTRPPRVPAMQRAGMRLSQAARPRDPVSRQLEAVAQTAPQPRVRAAAAQVLTQIVDLPQAERVRVVRRVLRSLGPAARVVRTEVVQNLEDHEVSPVAMATARMQPARPGRRSRGLRPVLQASPLVRSQSAQLQPAQPVSMVRAQPPVAASATVVTTPQSSSATSVERPRPSRRRSSLASRAAVRLAAPRTDRLLPPPLPRASTTPAPALTRSPVFRTARRPVLDSLQDVASPFVATAATTAARPVAASLDSSVAPAPAVVDVFGQPESLWSSELAPQTPRTASPTARAIGRLDRVDPVISDLIEVPEAIIQHKPAGETMGLRRHAVVRTARGAYMPASTVLAAPLQADEADEAGGSTTSATGVRTVEGMGSHGSTRRALEVRALQEAAQATLRKYGLRSPIVRQILAAQPELIEVFQAAAAPSRALRPAVAPPGKTAHPAPASPGPTATTPWLASPTATSAATAKAPTTHVSATASPSATSGATVAPDPSGRVVDATPSGRRVEHVAADSASSGRESGSTIPMLTRRQAQVALSRHERIRPRSAFSGDPQRRASSPASHAAARLEVGQQRMGSLRPVVSVAQAAAPSGVVTPSASPLAQLVAAVATTPLRAETVEAVVAAVQQSTPDATAEALVRALPPVLRAAVRAEAGALQSDSVVPKAIPSLRSAIDKPPADAVSGVPVASKQAMERIDDLGRAVHRTRRLRAEAPMAQLARPESSSEAETELPVATRRAPSAWPAPRPTIVVAAARAELPEVETSVSRRKSRRPAPVVAASTRDHVSPAVVESVIRVVIEGQALPARLVEQVVRRTRPSPTSYARGRRATGAAPTIELDLSPLARLLEEKAGTVSARTGSGRRMRAWAPGDTVVQPGSAEVGAAEQSDGARVIRGMTGDRRDLPQASTRSFRTPGGAPITHGRPLEWIGDRAQGSAPPVASTQRRRRPATPAFTESGTRESAGRIHRRAGTHKTPTGRWAAASVSRGPDGRFQSARRFGTARSARTLGELTLAEAASAEPTVAQSIEALAQAAPQELDSAAFAALPKATRAHLVDTLAAVDSRQTGGSLPVWAQRASGLPMVNGDGGHLFSALARATEVEEIVRIIVQRGGDLSTVRSSLPKPVLQVIEQIRTEAARPEPALEPDAPARGVSRAAWRQANQRSNVKVLSGFKSLRPAASGTRTQGVGADSVSKLAKKLKGLIHLAEGGQRGEARRQVRMAEESVAARQEGQSGPNSADTTGGQQVDVEALGREVLEVVSREMEMRRERQMGDSDEFWW